MIDENGDQLGIMSSSEALRLAREKELDLIEIAPNAKPPVTKLMDYGKYRYHQKKLDRKNRAKSKKNEVKGVRLGIKTDIHDLEVKKERVLLFLKKDFKVSLEVFLRGREKMYFDRARTFLEDFIKSLGVPIAFEQEIKRTPNGFNTVIKNAKQALRNEEGQSQRPIS